MLASPPTIPTFTSAQKPLVFNVTLSRTYRWQTENQDDQTTFLHSLIRLFRIACSTPLRLEGIKEPELLAGDDTSTKIDHTLRSAHSSSPSGQRGDSIPTKAQVESWYLLFMAHINLYHIACAFRTVRQ